MKDKFNKYRSRLTDNEKESLWQDITAPRDLEGERRVQFWRGLGVVSTSVAAVLILVIFWSFGGDDADRFERLAVISDSAQVGEVAMHEINRQIEESVADGKSRSHSPEEFAGDGADEKKVASPAGRTTEPAVAASDEAGRVLAPSVSVSDTESDGVDGERVETFAARRVTAPSTAPVAENEKTMEVVMLETEPVDSLSEEYQTGFGRIWGMVFDTDTGDPLAYANVVVEGTNIGSMTNEDGSFDLLLPHGSYSIFAQYMGYKKLVIENVTISEEQLPRIDFALVHSVALEMETVVINGGAPVHVVEGEVPVVDVKSSSVARDGNRTKIKSFAVDEVHEAMGLQAGITFESAPMGGKKGSGNTQAEADHMRSTKHRDLDEEYPRRDRYDVSGRLPRRRCWWPPEANLPNGEQYDAMFFEHYGVNPFIVTEEDALSTFASDVDNASYTLMRSYIERGSLPPADAIRVEEFVNFFDQGYEPLHDEDFAIHFDGMPSPYGDGYHLLRVSMQARTIRERSRKPANLVFVIDTSGSMDRENRLGLVKRALMILLDELRESDTVGIVEYGSRGRIVLHPTSLEDRRTIEKAIRSLHSNGSTNAEEGLSLAYEMASMMESQGDINRLILCSDGVANTGETQAERILRNVRYQSDRGIHLSAIGFGMGNYNDVLMEKLADKGDGNYYYVDDLDEAERVFRENLTGTLQTVARDAKIQVEFDPRQVLRYRLLGYENRDVADEDFRDDTVDAGEIGAGHVVTALYEIKLSDEVRREFGKRSKRGSRRSPLATARLRYEYPRNDRERAGEVVEMEVSADSGALLDKIDNADPRLRLAALVAEYAEILRGSFWARGSDLDDLDRDLRELAGELRGDQDVRELGLLLGRAVEFDER